MNYKSLLRSRQNSSGATTSSLSPWLSRRLACVTRTASQMLLPSAIHKRAHGRDNGLRNAQLERCTVVVINYSLLITARPCRWMTDGYTGAGRRRAMASFVCRCNCGSTRGGHAHISIAHFIPPAVPARARIPHLTVTASLICR